ncbi:MAG TPA: hypothetical protein VFB35_00480 [Gaiellaceae bacterium]|nr:hypothetical protein [Gaiellaceae bacterium]
MIPAALAAVALALPAHATVVPGKSFAGLRLGATSRQVAGAWGTRYGVCRGCARPTWFYTYRPFRPQGAAVVFRAGVAVGFYTLRAPAGWHTDRGLAVGDPQEKATAIYGVLPRAECGTYSALVLRGKRGETQLYVYGGKIWGFGLSSAGVPRCY